MAAASPSALAEGQPAPEPLQAPEAGPHRAEWGAGAPLVSILCHTYQHAGLLADAMNGFMAQRTDFPFEVVVHDDCSTDGTQEEIARWAERYPEIVRPLLQTHNQFSKGRRPLEFSLPAARGRYIAICEGDDYWTDPRKLQRQVEALEQRPACVLAGHDYLRAEAGRIERRYVHPPSSRRDQRAEDLLRASFYFHTATMLFRKPDEPVPPELTRVRNGDRLLTSWLGRYGGAVYVEGVAPTVYRRHGGGTWASQDPRQQASHHLTTWFWIAGYHERTGDPDTAAHFYGLILRECLRLSARAKPSWLKWIAEKLVRQGLADNPLAESTARAAVRALRKLR